MFWSAIEMMICSGPFGGGSCRRFSINTLAACAAEPGMRAASTRSHGDASATKATADASIARAARAAERFAAIPALGSLALFLVKFAPGSLALERDLRCSTQILISKQRARHEGRPVD